MDLVDRLRDLAARAPAMMDRLQTEEATKNALVMPFIAALGYDVFNPLEVIPEFTADVGIKKGEKVDYAIMQGDELIILIECKPITADLDKAHASQLYRYFSVTKARLGVLTNGVTYRVFSDLEDKNKMDSRPFLEFSLLDITDEVAGHLKKMTKSAFDIVQILESATDLKYLKGIKQFFHEEWTNPSEEFVRMFASKVYDGRFNQTTKDQFALIVKRAFHGFLNDRISERLKSVMKAGEYPEQVEVLIAESSHEASPVAEVDDGSKIITTEDEMEAFYIVKSIVREVVDAKRVFIRDTLSYCGVLLDDNNRRPICRLYFNGSKYHIGLFDASKNVTKHPIADLNDIYRLADDLKETVKRYENPSANDESEVQHDALAGSDDPS